MNQKYRVNEVAKDLNVQSSEIIELVEGTFGGSAKKNQTALQKEELDVIFEKFTQDNQVESFDKYFAATEKKPAKTEKPAAEDKSEAAEKPKAAKSTKTAKKPAAEKTEEKKPEVKAEPVPEVKPEPVKAEVKAEAPKPAVQEAPKTEAAKVEAPKTAAPAKTEPARQEHSQQSDRPQYNNNNNGYNRPNGDRPQYNNNNNGGYNRPNGDRPQYNNNNNGGYNRPSGDRPQYNNNNGGYNRPNGDRPQYNNNNNGGYNRPNGDRPQYNNNNNGGYNRPNGDRPQYNNNNNGGYNRPNGDRPQYNNNNGGYNRPNGDRPQYNKDGNGYNNRQGGYNNAPRPQQSAPKPVEKTVIDPSKIKVNAPLTAAQKAKGEAVQRGEQVTKMVDTRGSYVELDKYNERYESIAPVSRMSTDSFQKKQKINQKSQQNKGRPQYSNKRETEAQKLKRLELERARKQQLKVQIPDEIVVSELATRLKVTASEVIKKLFNLGEMCTINQVIDFDTASLVAEELGAKVEKEVIVTIEERLFEEVEDNDENLQPRSPVVVVMGHVDHGKTSLLDRIRNSSVTETEAGGITQHIGAYRVKLPDGKDITFLDTPGHEAFTAMRARGASITDIAILVVAADDGIMPQTVEAINHAKAANVQIIVAINKMDKPTANPDKIKQELTEQGLVIEEWGGDVICVPVSAKTGEGMDNLLEMVSMAADIMELKANPDRLAKGAVIEAKLDKGRGPVASVLVQNGTLHTGDIVIAGSAVGRIRVMRDDKGRVVKEAGPSVPVEIMGFAEVPSAGDTFAVVENEKLAKELVEQRKHDAKEEQFKLYHKVTLDNLFSSIEEGTMKELPIIVKADVVGSVEAVRASLEKISNEEVRVRVIHGGVGAVSESDVMLAAASGAIIVGFNVRPHPAAAVNAKRDGVEIKLYRVIYDAIEEITSAMKGMLAPKFREVEMARIEVRSVFKITGAGIVAGCYVLDGKVTRGCQIRVVRDGIIVGDDKIAGLRRFKDDVKDVAAGYECGISLDKVSDLKEGDIFEAYVMEEYKD